MTLARQTAQFRPPTHRKMATQENRTQKGRVVDQVTITQLILKVIPFEFHFHSACDGAFAQWLVRVSTLSSTSNSLER